MVRIGCQTICDVVGASIMGMNVAAFSTERRMA